MKVLTCLVLGIIGCREVNLVKLASYQNSDASLESQYRKLQRFFKLWVMPWERLALLTLSRIPKPKTGYILSLDRTNWKFGKTHINILTLGIVVGKVAVPLVWVTLPQSTKRGNSNGKQRIVLMKKALKILELKDIDFLAMDREFNGKQWLVWLNDKKLTWLLRLRGNTLVDGRHANKYRSTLKSKESNTKEVFGISLYFGCKKVRNGRTDYLYVVSNTLEPHEALLAYKKRWSIEVLFGHLKKKGFNFESTHLTHKIKIDKLMGVLTLAFIFTIGWGLILREKQKLNASQKRKSIFRLALDLLSSMFVNPDRYRKKLNVFGQWLESAIQPQIFVV